MAIKRRPSFNPKSFLARVSEGRSIHAYPETQIVFSQGDSADAVFYIQRGKVKITVVSKRGKEAVVAILGANEFFGEGCLAGQRHRIATAVTMTDSVVVRLEKTAILRVIHQEPAFAELFIAHLLGRTIRAESDLVDQLFNSSEKRLARLLLLLANFGKEDKPEPMKNQPGDARGDDRHDPVPCEFFHEQISKTRLHSLQRRHRSPQFIVESRSARGAAYRD